MRIQEFNKTIYLLLLTLFFFLITIVIGIRFYNIDFSNLDLLHNIWTYKSEYIFHGNYNYYYGIEGKDFYHEQQLINTLAFVITSKLLFFIRNDGYVYLILALLHTILNFLSLYLNFHGRTLNPFKNAIISFLLIFSLPFWDMHTCHLQIFPLWAPLLINYNLVKDGLKTYKGITYIFILLILLSAGPSYIGVLSYIILYFSLLYLRIGFKKVFLLSILYITPLLLFYNINYSYINLAINGNLREFWQFELYGVDLSQLFFNSYDSEILSKNIPRKINNGNLVLTTLPPLLLIFFFNLKKLNLNLNIVNREIWLGLFLIALSIGPYFSFSGHKLFPNLIGDFFFYVFPILKSFRYLPFFFISGYIFIVIYIVRTFDFNFGENGFKLISVLSVTILSSFASIYISYQVLISNSQDFPIDRINRIKNILQNFDAPTYLTPDIESSNQIYMISAVNQNARLINGSSGFFPLKAWITRNVQYTPQILCSFIGLNSKVINTENSNYYECNQINSELDPPDVLNMDNKYLYLILRDAYRIDANILYGNPVFSAEAISFQENIFTINPVIFKNKKYTSIIGLGFHSNNCKITDEVGVSALILSDILIKVDYKEGHNISSPSIKVTCNYLKHSTPVKILSTFTN
jgi:hypothetical protein